MKREELECMELAEPSLDLSEEAQLKSDMNECVVLLQFLIMDFIDGYFEWENMYRVNSPHGLFILSYEDYATACEVNPDSKVTYLWQESELLGTKLYRNINSEIHKIFK